MASPQPGDLAVWPGHAGIVVNPAQHSFFSVLHSGPGVDSYDSPYWKRRGRPRFFRYIKPTSGGSSSIRNATWRPTGSGTAQTHAPVVEDPTLAEEDEPASGTGASGKLDQSKPANSDTPLVAVVNSQRPRPDGVAAAFLQSSNNSEQRLRGSDLFKPDQSLVVFDHFEIRKVHIAGDQVWVDVQIDEPASPMGGKANVHKRSAKQRCPPTRRDRKGWELTPPRNAIYLPRQVAARLLAHELAQLTEDSATVSRAPEKARLAKLLNVLLEQ